MKKYFAPGRVNLIGEHLDYNGGQVLPMAISKGITATVSHHAEEEWRLTSADHDFVFKSNGLSLAEIGKTNQWSDYPIGVLKQWLTEGHPLTGMHIHFESNLPEGSGLSSSAALEVLTRFLLCCEFGVEEDRTEMALKCQRVENDFIGVKCGIMDQFAVARAISGHAMLLHCGTLQYQQIPFECDDYTVVVMNSCKPRTLIKSAYNERKNECEIALNFIQKENPLIAALANAGMEMLDAISDDLIRKRARHVITEKLRVQHAAQALENGDLHTFGRLMNASHASLKNDYEVSGQELDVLAETAQHIEGCLGARMTGAGFGGCAIALVRKTELNRFSEIISRNYKTRIGLECELFETAVGEGVRRLF